MKPTISLINDITAEYKLASHMVVFSHGFGVTREGGDNIFLDIIKQLPTDFGYVLFDYNKILGQKVELSDFASQVHKLKSIVEWLAEQPQIKTINLIGHSMGCIIIALAALEKTQTTVMIAPPTHIGENTRSYFTSKPGAKHHEKHWTLPRDNGSISVIPDSFIDEIESIDAFKVLKDYGQKQGYALVVAGKDEVLGDSEYGKLSATKGIVMHTMPGADHHFSGNSRQQLIELVKKTLTYGLT